MFRAAGLPGGGPAPLFLNECITHFTVTACVYLLLAIVSACALIIPNVMDVDADCEDQVTMALETSAGIGLTVYCAGLFGYYLYLASRKWWSDEQTLWYNAVHCILIFLAALCLVANTEIMASITKCHTTVYSKW
ncbi:putative transmembrane protein [Gregarina niphandrodes]|uniref:Transmembrane protein n=1 Tax=Gregarina niphandrodes TaxID=110365 RepID=A0A023BAF0_GRENI|nr:putative transmembrane protein [Gregarina niphandrodes]EZG78212.1 putative transmembrane protein [Gregarina niphandrodes]|eukprot:XP_011129401.1 putative transmembrane protein [Gregarina niphandrodes]